MCNTGRGNRLNAEAQPYPSTTVNVEMNEVQDDKLIFKVNDWKKASENKKAPSRRKNIEQ